MDHRILNLAEPIIPETWVYFRKSTLQKTQEDLAQECGIEHHYLQALEQGFWDRLPFEWEGCLNLLKIISDHVGVSIADLFPEFMDLINPEPEVPISEIGDEQPSIEELLFVKEKNKELNLVLQELPLQSRLVMILRYGLNGEDPLTLSQVGERIGKSTERVRQIEKKAIEQIEKLYTKIGSLKSKSESVKPISDTVNLNPVDETIVKLSDFSTDALAAYLTKHPLPNISIYDTNHWSLLTNLMSLYLHLSVVHQDQLNQWGQEILSLQGQEQLAKLPYWDQEEIQSAYFSLENMIKRIGSASKKETKRIIQEKQNQEQRKISRNKVENLIESQGLAATIKQIKKSEELNQFWAICLDQGPEYCRQNWDVISDRLTPNIASIMVSKKWGWTIPELFKKDLISFNEHWDKLLEPSERLSIILWLFEKNKSAFKKAFSWVPETELLEALLARYDRETILKNPLWLESTIGKKLQLTTYWREYLQSWMDDYLNYRFIITQDHNERIHTRLLPTNRMYDSEQWLEVLPYLMKELNLNSEASFEGAHSLKFYLVAEPK